jgi:cell division protein FtsZ
MPEMITFEPKKRPSYIKVLGVGGDGRNAVNHMFKLRIKDVDFVVCNTDLQALESSPVPAKIELGNNGLGAGAKAEVGRTAAEESLDKIKEVLDSNTQMLFITAGMGGGTGTGAAPVIAEVAKELGILTVGIVTIPFSWEGRKRRQQADLGIQEIKKHVDTLLVISNDKLREQFGDLELGEAFAMADNVLTSAAKGIAELITVPGYINIDFQDVKTVIEDSGKAIMGSATAEGENRAITAIEEAMSSPLLDDNDITGAQNILLYIVTGEEDLRMDEITEITDYIQQECGGEYEADVIWGNGKDESLGNKISITIIATGFDNKTRKTTDAGKKIVGEIGKHNTSEPTTKNTDKESAEPVVELKLEKQEAEEEKELKEETVEATSFDSLIHMTHHDEVQEPEIKLVNKAEKSDFDTPKEEPRIVKETKSPEPASEPKETPESNKDGFRLFKTTKRNKSDHTPAGVGYTISSSTEKTETEPEVSPSIEEENEALQAKTEERAKKLKDYSINLNNADDVAKLESEPAYMRKNIHLDNTPLSEKDITSRYTLSDDGNNNPVIKSDNSFLHDNVD